MPAFASAGAFKKKANVNSNFTSLMSTFYTAVIQLACKQLSTKERCMKCTSTRPVYLKASTSI